MEGSIARWYEKTTRKDMNQFRLLAERIATMLPAGGDILEVAPGPGFLSIELAKGNRFRVTGLDISRTFVDLARRNAEELGVGVRFEQGNASKMPFPEKSFDFLICRAAFKNFSDPIGALQEMHRVLKPGGRALIIDLRRDTSMSEIAKYVDGLGVSALNRLFMKFVFRFSLLKRAYTMLEFERMLARIPFRNTEIRPEPVGMEIWFER
uniref:Class I SAM-dependent methyltransferase n=2 Tax=Paracidobacterium acidisoli TaxID=2303751 RepID=A0A372IUV0_9BACT